jgi:hypothetical protein
MHPGKDESHLTAERLRDLLDYNPETGVFTWRVNRPGRFGRVGAVRSDGPRQICIDQQIILTGRLAHLWMTGRWPKLPIDHKNLDPADDRWSNLREATYSQNGANSGDRYSGVDLKGVSWDRARRKYAAKIRVNYQTINLGRFESAREAHDAYAAAANTLWQICEGSVTCP